MSAERANANTYASSLLAPSALALLAALTSASCSRAEAVDPTARPPTPDEIPVSMPIRSAAVTLGVATGHLRSTTTLGSYRITQFPVTNAAYKLCQGAGACPTPSANACKGAAAVVTDAPLPSRELPDDEQPAVCVGVAQARAYCTWVGGRLPTASEWLLAARGSDVHRYAWGDSPPNCEQHAGGQRRIGNRLLPCGPGRSADGLLVGPVHAHPKGRSLLGVEDVLLTDGELTGASDDAIATACAPPFAGCVVEGQMPGAIDGFEPVATDTVQGGETILTPYGFRCVW